MVKTNMLPAKHRQGFGQGFSLIELMTVIAIMGILLAIAVPNYFKYVREARRAEAQSQMMEIRLGMERWRANKISYRSDADTTNTATTNTLANAGFTGTNDYYTYTITNTAASTYTINATAVAGKSQVNDVAGSISCTPMTLNQSNVKTNAACWKK